MASAELLAALTHARANPDEPTVWYAGARRGRREAAPLSERLFEGVDTSDPNACWESSSQPSQTYANIGIAGRKIGRHRASFFLANGFMPTVVRHTCDNPPCINPGHLLGGTHRENSADMVARGRDGGRKLRGRKRPRKASNPQEIAA